MSRNEIMAQPHPGQHTVHVHQARFKVLAAGRRWGKTRLGVHECLDVASKGGRAWWVAPTYKTANVGWRPLRRMGYKIGAEVSKGDRTVTLSNGGEVTVRSADNPDGLRGEGLDFVALDECAFMQEDAWIESLRPSLSDRLGSAMFFSTPKGRNWFWKLYQRGQDDKVPDWMSWKLPTSDNPYIAAEEIEDARLSLPELTFEQEYLAEFLVGEGTVFRNIYACMNAPLADPDDHKGHRVIAGLDLAKQADFTTISIGCADCKVELATDRFNQIDYIFQMERVKAICEKWHVQTLLVDESGVGSPIVEQLQRDLG